MNIQDDPLYEDLYEGNLTESSDGATAIWELFFLIFLKIPFLLIAGLVRLIRGR